MNHARCALCRHDLGLLADHPRLCEECAELVTPAVVWAPSAREAFARGYASAVFHSVAASYALPADGTPPRNPEALEDWLKHTALA